MSARRRLVPASSAGGWLATALVRLGIATPAMTSWAVAAMTAREEKDSDQHSGDEDHDPHHLHPPGSPGRTFRFRLRAGVVSELVVL